MGSDRRAICQVRRNTGDPTGRVMFRSDVCSPSGILLHVYEVVQWNISGCVVWWCGTSGIRGRCWVKRMLLVAGLAGVFFFRKCVYTSRIACLSESLDLPVLRSPSLILGTPAGKYRIPSFAGRWRPICMTWSLRRRAGVFLILAHSPPTATLSNLLVRVLANPSFRPT